MCEVRRRNSSKNMIHFFFALLLVGSNWLRGKCLLMSSSDLLKYIRC